MTTPATDDRTFLEDCLFWGVVAFSVVGFAFCVALIAFVLGHEL